MIADQVMRCEPWPVSLLSAPFHQHETLYLFGFGSFSLQNSPAQTGRVLNVMNTPHTTLPSFSVFAPRKLGGGCLKIAGVSILVFPSGASRFLSKQPLNGKMDGFSSKQPQNAITPKSAQVQCGCWLRWLEGPDRGAVRCLENVQREKKS